MQLWSQLVRLLCYFFGGIIYEDLFSASFVIDLDCLVILLLLIHSMELT